MKTFPVIFIALFCVLSLRAGNAEMEKAAGVTPQMLERAARFRQALKTDSGYRSGAYIYTKRSIADYAGRPEKLAARLRLAGMTDVYMSCERAISGQDSDALKWQKKFIRAAHTFGLKAHAIRLTSGRLYVGNEKLYEECKLIMDYNYSVKQAERFDGVSADMEPHTMKKGFVDRPKSLDLYWSSDNYGIGKDNDLLLKRTVEVMKTARRELRPLPLSQAIGFFFQPRVDKGILKHGGAGEFLQYCDFLIVMAYNYRRERIWEMSEPILAAAGEKPQSVSICIKTSMGTFGDEGPVTSVQPHGWKNLIECVDFLTGKGAGFATFRGVDIFEYQGFEMMWSSGEDKMQDDASKAP